jgi:thiol-disulfide isomerase/thioredoxin
MEEIPRKKGKKLLAIIVATIVIVAAAIGMLILWRPAATTAHGNGVGDIPYDFTLPDTNNVLWNLQSHISNGKPILLEFIQLNATYCRTMAPVLDQIQADYHASIEVVSIAIKLEGGYYPDPPTQSSTAQARSEMGSMWTYLFEANGIEVRDTYNVTAVPMFFLLGKDGRIAWTHAGAVDYGTLAGQIESVL